LFLSARLVLRQRSQRRQQHALQRLQPRAQRLDGAPGFGQIEPDDEKSVVERSIVEHDGR